MCVYVGGDRSAVGCRRSHFLCLFLQVVYLYPFGSYSINKVNKKQQKTIGKSFRHHKNKGTHHITGPILSLSQTTMTQSLQALYNAGMHSAILAVINIPITHLVRGAYIMTE